MFFTEPKQNLAMDAKILEPPSIPSKPTPAHKHKASLLNTTQTFYVFAQELRNLRIQAVNLRSGEGGLKKSGEGS